MSERNEDEKTPLCHLQRLAPLTSKQYLAWGRRNHQSPKRPKGMCLYACPDCLCASADPRAKSVEDNRYCPVEFRRCEHARWYCVGSIGSELEGRSFRCLAYQSVIPACSKRESSGFASNPSLRGVAAAISPLPLFAEVSAL